MLTESDLAQVDTDLFQKEADTGEKVSQGLIIDDTVLHSLANGHFLCRRLTGQLGFTVKQVKLNVLHLGETAVFLTAGWVDDCEKRLVAFT